MNEPLVVVASSFDRAHCLGLARRLSHDGIPALVSHGSETLFLGAPRFAVTVPRSTAREAVRALAAEVECAGPYRTAAVREDEERMPTRQRRLAAFFALGLAFGLGHVYAREHVAGVILGVGQLLCFVLAMQGLGEVLWAFPALVALDAWGAMRAVDRENEGHRREPVAQLAAALPAVALFLACAATLAPSSSTSQRPVAALSR